MGARVADQALELVALVDLAAALEVHVLVQQLEAVVTRVGRDGLPLALR
ncbi:MAG TPA: hypothetical protein VFY45_15450 [Baekduia sp.]|nr:hypothetical protein [Baekduia sp.]